MPYSFIYAPSRLSNDSAPSPSVSFASPFSQIFPQVAFGRPQLCQRSGLAQIRKFFDETDFKWNVREALCGWLCSCKGAIKGRGGGLIRSGADVMESANVRALSWPFSVNGIEFGAVVARPAFAALSACRINLRRFITGPSVWRGGTASLVLGDAALFFIPGISELVYSIRNLRCFR
jgi:hypothetical protein